jgi:hypothetical protein
MAGLEDDKAIVFVRDSKPVVNKEKKEKKADPFMLNVKMLTVAELQKMIDDLTRARDESEVKLIAIKQVSSFKIDLGETLLKLKIKVPDLVQTWATNAKGVVGEITKMDFRKHARKVLDWQNVKDIDAFFSEVDADGGGTLDAKELTVAVQKLQDEARSKEEQLREAQQKVEWFLPRIQLAQAALQLENEDRRQD